MTMKVRTRAEARTTAVTATPRLQLERFMKKYSFEVAAEGREALKRLRRLVPGAVQIVYDNYNGLVVGFGPPERASEAVLSRFFAPRWLAVSFLQNAAALPDPRKLLRVSARQVRIVGIHAATEVDKPRCAR
jgi:hypothetical protein